MAATLRLLLFVCFLTILQKYQIAGEPEEGRPQPLLSAVRSTLDFLSKPFRPAGQTDRHQLYQGIRKPLLGFLSPQRKSGSPLRAPPSTHLLPPPPSRLAAPNRPPRKRQIGPQPQLANKPSLANPAPVGNIKSKPIVVIVNSGVAAPPSLLLKKPTPAVESTTPSLIRTGGFSPPQPHQIISLTKPISTEVSVKQPEVISAVVGSSVKISAPSGKPESLAGNYLELENGLGGSREKAGSPTTTRSPPTKLYQDDSVILAAHKGNNNDIPAFLKEPLASNERLTLSTFEAAEATQRPPDQVAVSTAATPLRSEEVFIEYLDDDEEEEEEDAEEPVAKSVPVDSTSFRPIIQPKRFNPVLALAQAARPAEVSRPLPPVKPWVDPDPDFRQLDRDLNASIEAREFQASINSLLEEYDDRFVSRGYEELLDEKIVEIQREAERLEQRLWGGKEKDFRF